MIEWIHLPLLVLNGNITAAIECNGLSIKVKFRNLNPALKSKLNWLFAASIWSFICFQWFVDDYWLVITMHITLSSPFGCNCSDEHFDIQLILEISPHFMIFRLGQRRTSSTANYRFPVRHHPSPIIAVSLQRTHHKKDRQHLHHHIRSQ